MAHTTYNTSNFIDAQVYSSLILGTFDEYIMPDAFYRNVSDFPGGTTLNIKTIGDVSIQELYEDVPPVYNAISTGTVTLTITDYVGNAWYVSDILRQDGSQIDALMAEYARKNMQALAEEFETRLYATANSAQTASDLNNINGFKHRFVASGSNDTMSEDDLIDMKLSFDKAKVPMAGRVAIVDPVVEATFNKKVILTSQVDMNPTNQALMESGFAQDHKFLVNLFGWNIWTSNLLPKGISETVDSVSVSDGIANIFMCVADDSCKPLMAAWRQMPTVETERDIDNARDKFIVRSRYGVGSQRVDSLGVILTSATATE